MTQPTLLLLSKNEELISSTLLDCRKDTHSLKSAWSICIQGLKATPYPISKRIIKGVKRRNSLIHLTTNFYYVNVTTYVASHLRSRSSHPEVFLVKGVLKICSRFTGEYPYQSAISIKLLCNFIEIALRNGCSHVNLLHIFRTPFPKSTSGWLFL